MNEVEIKILDDYLLGRTTSYWPLPAIEEVISLIKILNAIKKATFSGRTERV